MCMLAKSSRRLNVHENHEEWVLVTPTPKRGTPGESYGSHRVLMLGVRVTQARLCKKHPSAHGYHIFLTITSIRGRSNILG